MIDKTDKKIRHVQKKVVVISVLLGIVFGVLDSIVDSYLFLKDSFLETLILDVGPREIYMRGLLLVGITACGIFVAKVIGSKMRAELDAKFAKERLELALKGAKLGLWDWDMRSGEVFFNKRWAGMLGYETDEIAPTVEAWQKLMHPEDRDSVTEALTEHLEGRSDHYETEHRLRAKDDTWKWILDSGRVFERDADGKPLRAAGTHRDITESKRLEDELKVLASTDYLTGVANRMYGLGYLQMQMSQSKRNNAQLCVCFVDLNKLKKINDEHGHDEGDEAIKRSSEIMHSALRESDMVIRLGGDEFLLVLPNCTMGEASTIWGRISEGVKNYNENSGKPYALKLSHGFALYGRDSLLNVDELISMADKEMYREKRG
ncbi:MAG: diguanylate cyclase [Thermodesulfovibrionales bacterium]|nr:diguanylate cyclase [Thermodesulfovibrionales bacterium]